MEVPGEIAYRHVVLRTVAAACKVAIRHVCGRHASASGFTHQVVSAVGEAFNNIVAHCYRDRATDIVRIAMTVETDRLVVTLEDRGPSFDPLTARLPDLGSLPESGLGVFIMRSMMDEVGYRPGKPNRLILSKRIRQCPGGLPQVEGRRASDGLFKE